MTNWKYEGLIQNVKMLLRVLNALENSTNPWQTQIDVGFTKTNSKDELPGTHESPCELVRQSEAKRKQAPQSEANVRRRQMQSRKNLPY